MKQSFEKNWSQFTTPHSNSNNLQLILECPNSNSTGRIGGQLQLQFQLHGIGGNQEPPRDSTFEFPFLHPGVASIPKTLPVTPGLHLFLLLGYWNLN